MPQESTPRATVPPRAGSRSGTLPAGGAGSDTAAANTPALAPARNRRGLPLEGFVAAGWVTTGDGESSGDGEASGGRSRPPARLAIVVRMRRIMAARGCTPS